MRPNPSLEPTRTGVALGPLRFHWLDRDQSRLLLVSRCSAFRWPGTWSPTMVSADFCTLTSAIAGERVASLIVSCCHVPARLACLGFLCGFCPSPRISCTLASSGRFLAGLPLPSARGYTRLTMNPSRYSHGGFAPYKFEPPRVLRRLFGQSKTVCFWDISSC